MSLRNIFYITSLLHILKPGESEMQGFIVEGDFATIDKFPHTAYISVGCKQDFVIQRFGCGASIVNQIVLITAAHCLEDCDPNSIIGVAIGTVEKKRRLSNAVSKFVIHKHYSPENFNNDIALVKLWQSLTLGPKVQRVLILRKPPYNQPAEIAGWGVVDEKINKHTYFLKYAKQKVWSREKCIRLLDDMPKGTLCADSEYTEKNKVGYASKGDSGSGLIVKGFIQIGLVSYKKPMKSKSVVVYTDLGYHYDWINQTTKTLCCTSLI